LGKNFKNAVHKTWFYYALSARFSTNLAMVPVSQNSFIFSALLFPMLATFVLPFDKPMAFAAVISKFNPLMAATTLLYEAPALELPPKRQTKQQY
jgi:hypothetical protein